MKQLYSSGLLGTFPAGAVLKASSAGVPAAALDLALNYPGYAVPQPGSHRPMPVRLSLLNTPQGRVLTHTAPDGATFFAHTLLNVPASADAQLAIQTWGSPLWQKHDPEGTADLPEVPYLPVADVLDDAVLKDWLSTPARLSRCRVANGQRTITRSENSVARRAASARRGRPRLRASG